MCAKCRTFSTLGLPYITVSGIWIKKLGVGGVLDQFLYLFDEPPLHLVDSVYRFAPFGDVVSVVIEVIEDVRVFSIFMVANHIANLSVNLVVREMVAASRDYWITALPVVAGFSGVELRVMRSLRNDDVHRESAFEAFGIQRELVRHTCVGELTIVQNGLSRTSLTGNRPTGTAGYPACGHRDYRLNRLSVKHLKFDYWVSGHRDMPTDASHS